MEVVKHDGTAAFKGSAGKYDGKFMVINTFGVVEPSYVYTHIRDTSDIDSYCRRLRARYLDVALRTLLCSVIASTM